MAYKGYDENTMPKKLGQTYSEYTKKINDTEKQLFDNDDFLNTTINNLPNTADATIQMDGDAAKAGTSAKLAKADHIHPHDSTKLDAEPTKGKSLIVDDKINTYYIPDTILGQVRYRGTWDAGKDKSNASVNVTDWTPDIGDYLICTAAGQYDPNNTTSTATTLVQGGYAVGDWAIVNKKDSDGKIIWEKVDNTDAVTSVNNRIGAVKTYHGTWVSNKSYFAGDIVKQDKKYYIANNSENNINQTPPNTSFWECITPVTSVNSQEGDVQIYQGTFVPNTAYHKGDIVLSGDALYLYINDASEVTSTTADALHWKIFGMVYTEATQEKSGLMSAADKKRLDELIVTGAAVKSVNGYTGDVKTYKGQYGTGTTCHQGDIVLFGGDLYLCIKDADATININNASYYKIFGKVYTNASKTADGLMSKEDKTTFDILVDRDANVKSVNGQTGVVKTYKGTWDSSTMYYPGDIVTDPNTGELYLYIYATATSINALTDTDHWKIFGKVYSEATTDAAGLMSAQDKTDLDANTAARHTHTNKALLDTYTQTEANLADAVSKKHSHSNKALLDTYNQTNANIKDAVDKKHTHTNKSILDATTASFTTEEKEKLANLTPSELGTVKGVVVNGTNAVGADGIARINIDDIQSTYIPVSASATEGWATAQVDGTTYQALSLVATDTEFAVFVGGYEIVTQRVYNSTNNTLLVCIGTSKVDCVIRKLSGGAVNVTSNTGTGDVSAAGNNTFSGDNSFTGPVHFLGTDSVYFSSIINSGYGISGTSYSLKSDSLVSPETTKLLLGAQAAGANTTSYGVGQIINKQATLTLPTTSGTLATTADISGNNITVNGTHSTATSLDYLTSVVYQGTAYTVPKYYNHTISINITVDNSTKYWLCTSAVTQCSSEVNTMAKFRTFMTNSSVELPATGAYSGSRSYNIFRVNGDGFNVVYFTDSGVATYETVSFDNSWTYTVYDTVIEQKPFTV